MAPVSTGENSLNPADTLIKGLLETKTTVSISEYIFLRIHQLGINSIFGVPGDFNLNFLEHIYDVPSLNWIGCCNELNAAYAADAYGKESKKMGVLLTTYGVGELSALNGIAGAYTEYAPVLHLVGTSAMKFKRDPKAINLHHLIGNKKNFLKSDHYLYERVASEFSVDCASIEDDPIAACEMIDRVIVNVWKKSRPGYIFLPCDLPDMQVDLDRLNKPLDLSYDLSSNFSKVDSIVDSILEMIYKNKNVSLLVDDFVRKFRMQKEVDELIEKLENKVNLFNTWFSRGNIHEDHPRFVGTYIGKYEHQVDKLLEGSDLVLHLGKLDNEMNTGFYTANIDESKLIVFHPQYMKIADNELDEEITMMDILPSLVQKLDSKLVNVATSYEKPLKLYEQVNSNREHPLTEIDLINTLSNSLRKNDTLIVETCSFLFAVADIKFNSASLVSQGYWASIGYALPATLGVALAKRDFNIPGKVITVEGDGSAQMSLQELSSFMRYNIDATMFILNNEGYTIERVIVGPYSGYNDINTKWQWTKLLNAFGDVNNDKTNNFTIETAEALNELVQKGDFYNAGKFQLVELILPMFDVPAKLTQMTSKK